MSADRITRHAAIDRAFHWLMALCMFALLVTGLAPKLGVEFEWVTIHWIAGLLLTVIVVGHAVRALFWQSVRSMWFGACDLDELRASIGRAGAGGTGAKPGKYSLAQRLMHHAVTVFCLAALGTGIVMLPRIDGPLWTRDPYLFGAETWGVIYVIHGLAALVFVSLIVLHVYFAIRPEKLFYLRAMVFGWITRGELEANHDPKQWRGDA
ncbi:MAG: cytochrome b/b6 domain-containing protein [Rhodospirillaceae bacterium]|nr:cytochrome b/b6 domain-containing protein [Rhodospirillaceae bacterium]